MLFKVFSVILLFLLAVDLESTFNGVMVQNGGHAKDAAFDVEGFKKTLQLRAEIEAGGNGAAPASEKYYDLSYYRLALAKIM
jgi:hypothetical protein